MSHLQSIWNFKVQGRAKTIVKLITKISFSLKWNNNMFSFQSNPKYNFAYQVSDEVKQTYLAHKEERDGNDVTGEYRYQTSSMITKWSNTYLN